LNILRILAWVGGLGVAAYLLGQCAINVEEARVPQTEAPKLGIVTDEKPAETEE
jgi:hypothetical protein